jgi:hypothetical protein
MQQSWGNSHHDQGEACLGKWLRREALNRSVSDEFYSGASRRKQPKDIEDLQIDLDNAMDSYNYWRTHQGYNLKRMAREY